MYSYFLLQTMSDEPVIISEKTANSILGNTQPNCFAVVKHTKLIDIVLEKKPSAFPLNFVAEMSLGLIQVDFLETIMSLKKFKEYAYTSGLFFKDHGETIDTGLIFYKCKNVIYARSGKSSIFRKEKTGNIIYVPDGKEYITHVPSYDIPIYGTQLRGQLIVREDLMENIVDKKIKKVHVAKLKVKDAVDGHTFKDSFVV